MNVLRRSKRPKRAPIRFRFSSFAAQQPAVVTARAAATATPLTPTAPTPVWVSSSPPSDALQQYTEELARLGGFAVVNDYDTQDDENSFRAERES